MKRLFASYEQQIHDFNSTTDKEYMIYPMKQLEDFFILL